MAEYKLASERLNTGGSLGGLTPTLLTDRSRGLRASSINPNAANVRFTPLPIPEIVVDTTLASGAKMAAVWNQAAFQFQQRQEDTDAKTAVIAASSRFGDLLYGKDGFGTKSGGNAVKAHEGYTGQIRQVTSDTLSLLSPGAQTKALTLIKQQENLFLQRGAKHTAQQQKVLETNVFKAQYDTFLRDAINTSTSGDPADFDTSMAVPLAQLQAQFKDQPEAYKVAAHSFKTDVISKVVGMQIDLKNFDLAKDFIVRGKHQYGVDSVVSAKLMDQVYMAQKRDESISNTLAAQRRAAEKDAARVSLNNNTNAALKYRDPSFLDNILNPIDRTKATEAFNKLYDVVTLHDDLVSMKQDVQRYRSNPSLVFDSTDGYQVNYAERTKMYNQLLVDQKAGVTRLKKENEDLVDVMLAKEKMGMFGKYEQAEARTTKYLMVTAVDEAIDLAVRDNEDPEMAMFKAQKEIWDDPHYNQSYKKAIPPFVAIKGLPNGDLAELEFYLDETGKYQKNSPISIEYIERKYDKVNADIFMKHGVTKVFDTPFTSSVDIVQALATVLKTPQARIALMKDLEDLSQQRRRYLALGAESDVEYGDDDEYGIPEITTVAPGTYNELLGGTTEPRMTGKKKEVSKTKSPAKAKPKAKANNESPKEPDTSGFE